MGSNPTLSFNNKAVDPRLSTVGTPGGGSPPTWGPTQKGGIVSLDGTSSFTFHYNPSSVQVSHVMDMDTAADYLAAQNNKDNADTGAGIVAMSNTTVSFELLLDRSYELWGGDRSTQNAAHQGVWHDIVVLYQMVGIINGTDLTAVLPMQYWAGFLLLDGRSTLNLGSPTLYGFLSGLDYTLTHWTYDMIPIRATMDIQWTLQPNPKKVTGRNLQATGAGTTAFGTQDVTSLAAAIGAASKSASAVPSWVDTPAATAQ